MAFIASFFQLGHIFGNGIFAFYIPLADSRHNFPGGDSLQNAENSLRGKKISLNGLINGQMTSA